MNNFTEFDESFPPLDVVTNVVSEDDPDVFVSDNQNPVADLADNAEED